MPDKSTASPSATRTTKVFLSHSWGDKRKQHEFALLVCQELKKRDGLEPIIDEEHFFPGTSWRDIVKDVMKNERAIVIFFISKEFLLSPACQFEFNEARNAFIMKGMPLIPVKIDDAKVPALLEDKIYLDLQSEFRLFIEGKLDAACLAEKLDLLAKGISTQIAEYENKVHITRVLHPKDEAFINSRQVFDSYPENFRDSFEMVQQWVGESSDPDRPNPYFDEVYLVAYHQGKCMGVLYATHYRKTLHNKGYCVIYPLVVAKGAETAAGKVVARELLHELREQVSGDDCHCERFLLELPWRRELNDQEMAVCLRGWRTLAMEDDLCALPGLTYLSPDASEFMHTVDKSDYEAEQMHLLTVFGYPDRHLTCKEMKRDLLHFLYGVYHAEAYGDPFMLRSWVDTCARLQKEVEAALPDAVDVTTVDPADIENVLLKLEASVDG